MILVSIGFVEECRLSGFLSIFYGVFIDVDSGCDNDQASFILDALKLVEH
jgi:hypothetical protein